MRKFYCFGKKDFCDHNSDCAGCPHNDDSGGVYREAPITNADHIRSMTDDELAVFLECFGVCHYCPEHERLENEPLLRGERCDEDCEKHMLDWLKQPYKP